MPNAPTQESPHNEALRRITARLDAADTQMKASLTLRDDHGGQAVVAPLGDAWQPLPGRERVRVRHIEHPDRPGELFFTLAITEPGAHYEGSVLDESRLLGLMSGDLTLNGKPYTPGQFLWLAPGEPSTWNSFGGAMCGVLYNTPPPDLDLSDLIVPVKP